MNIKNPWNSFLSPSIFAIVSVASLVAVNFLYFETVSLTHELSLLRKTVDTLLSRQSLTEDLTLEAANQSLVQTISTEVGRIQFIDKFTIELERADFRSEGLLLAGYLGNPNNYDVSVLTILVEGASRTTRMTVSAMVARSDCAGD